jgi:hypothetical protein
MCVQAANRNESDLGQMTRERKAPRTRCHCSVALRSERNSARYSAFWGIVHLRANPSRGQVLGSPEYHLFIPSLSAV